MKVLLFGASGMVGQGVLRECLLDPDVTHAVAVGRSPLGKSDPKLGELVVSDFYDYSPVESKLKGFDACFFCLGVSAVGHERGRLPSPELRPPAGRRHRAGPAESEDDFRLRDRRRLRQHRAGSADVGARQGRDRERLAQAALQGRLHVPSRRDPATARCSLEDAAVPVGIYSADRQPLFGAGAPLAAQCMVTTSEKVGRAMLAVAKRGAPSPYVEMSDIHRLGV